MKTFLCAIACLTFFNPSAQSADLDEVLSQYYEVFGGVETLEGIETMVMNGKGVVAGGIEFPMKIITKSPGRFRSETNFQGQVMVQACDGTRAWQINPMMGSTEPQELPKEMADEFAKRSELAGPFVKWKEKGYKLEYLGVVDIEGSPCHHLKLTRDDESVENHYLDEDACVPVMTSMTARDMMGNESEQRVFYSDYKEVGDSIAPFNLKIKNAEGVQVFEMIFDTIEVNVPLEDDIFAMPEPKTTEQEETVE